MLINHERRFIFVHVPKTGGCSIRRVLNGETDKRSFHRSLSTLKGKHSDYFSFGFVRNPWDRMVSLYNFCILKPKSRPGFDPSIEQAGFKKSLIKGFDAGQRDAMWYLYGCDFVGKMENFQNDFNIICKEIGIGKLILPMENAREHSHYRDYYDDESMAYVEKTHSATIEQFGYTF